MFYSQIDKMIDACYEELMQAPDQEIQDALKVLKDNIPTQFFKQQVCEFLKDNITVMMFSGIDEKDYDELFVTDLKEFAERSLNLKKSIIVDVKMKGQEEHVSRVLEIPYLFTVADLAYAVLASMNSLGYFMFLVKYQNEEFYCNSFGDFDLDENFCFASLKTLDELELTKGSKLHMIYDFENDFEFEIIVKDIKDHQEVFDVKDMNIQSGKGYGIWEKAHYEMNLYYNDHKAFKRYLEKNDLDEDMYPYEEFDLEMMNDILISEFLETKEAYEEEPEDFEVPYFDDEIHISDDDLPF